MQANVIQRQYDEVIASHYDFDPQSVVGDSLDRAIGQLQQQHRGEIGDQSLRVLDLGMGTGLFLEKLRTHTVEGIQPFGLDISQKMIDIAHARIPDLVSAVDDAANLDQHFPTLSFDLVGTHFITGFVPVNVLAPKIRAKLKTGGYWSFVGGTMAGFPELQAKAATLPLKKFLFGTAKLAIDDMVCNPANQEEVVRTLEAEGFTVCECETFRPDLRFENLNDFMEFAYYGGWLTPFVEALGLHRPKPMVRLLLNKFFFPVNDHHDIVIALAQKR
jgi:SAM-dependent methyltransferase